ncbi:MAG: DUF2156 domain-containing protein [Pirellulaceae bacterium]|nr:DUF2156 domain-containing protein [Pirellulaceae bacterium]
MGGTGRSPRAESSADDAAWNFREACYAVSVWPVFYQVEESSLGRYVEMGLKLVKIGEEAKVPLSTFSLNESDKKNFRRTQKKNGGCGHTF